MSTDTPTRILRSNTPMKETGQLQSNKKFKSDLTAQFEAASTLSSPKETTRTQNKISPASSTSSRSSPSASPPSSPSSLKKKGKRGRPKKVPVDNPLKERLRNTPVKKSNQATSSPTKGINFDETTPSRTRLAKSQQSQQRRSSRQTREPDKFSPAKTSQKKVLTKNKPVTKTSAKPKRGKPEKVPQDEEMSDDQNEVPIELNIYQKYSLALSTTIKSELVFREKETNEIRSFLDDHLQAKKSSSIYVLGRLSKFGFYFLTIH